MALDKHCSNEIWGWRETRSSLEAKNPVIKAQVITKGDDKDLGS